MAANYLALMLVNMVAGLVLLARFAMRGLMLEDKRRYATGFAMVGLVALLPGLPVIWTWPLPGSFNCAFGEMAVLFGVVFMGLACSVGFGLRLGPVGIYAVFAGAAAIEVGVWIIKQGMTKQPGIAGLGFTLSGLAGILLLPTVRAGASRALRVILSVVCLLAALIWALIGYGAYWSHLTGFTGYTPAG